MKIPYEKELEITSKILEEEYNSKMAKLKELYERKVLNMMEWYDNEKKHLSVRVEDKKICQYKRKYNKVMKELKKRVKSKYKGVICPHCKTKTSAYNFPFHCKTKKHLKNGGKEFEMYDIQSIASTASLR